MTSTHVYPKYKLDAFNCPLCNAYAHQRWYELTQRSTGYVVPQLEISVCIKCRNTRFGSIKDDISGNHLNCRPKSGYERQCKNFYNEARAVYPHSKRAAAALLRLSLQFLCKQLGATEDNPNKAIDELVKKGLNPQLKNHWMQSE